MTPDGAGSPRAGPVDVRVSGVWHELRNESRRCRAEPITASMMLDAVFPTDCGRLMERWFALQRQNVPVT
jgi:hypothetical protein